MIVEVSLAKLAEMAMQRYEAPLCEHGHEMVRDAVFIGRRCTGKVAYTCPICLRLARVSEHHRHAMLKKIKNSQ